MASDPYMSSYSGGSLIVTSPFTTSPFQSTVQIGSLTYPSAAGYSFSIGDIVKDLGDFIVTAAGEVLRTAINQFGQRIIEKTGEVIARSPIGPYTQYPQPSTDYTPFIIGGALIAAILLLR